jgi:hypothetical protein
MAKEQRIIDFFQSNPDISIYEIVHAVIKTNGIIGVGLVSFEQSLHNAIWDKNHNIDMEVQDENKKA